MPGWSARVVSAAEGPGGSSRAVSAEAFVAPRPGRDPAGVTGVLAGRGFQCVIRGGMPEDTISYRNDNGTWLNTAKSHALAVATPARSPRVDAEITPRTAPEDSWI